MATPSGHTALGAVGTVRPSLAPDAHGADLVAVAECAIVTERVVTLVLNRVGRFVAAVDGARDAAADVDRGVGDEAELFAAGVERAAKAVVDLGCRPRLTQPVVATELRAVAEEGVDALFVGRARRTRHAVVARVAHVGRRAERGERCVLAGARGLDAGVHRARDPVVADHRRTRRADVVHADLVAVAHDTVVAVGVRLALRRQVAAGLRIAHLSVGAECVVGLGDTDVVVFVTHVGRARDAIVAGVDRRAKATTERAPLAAVSEHAVVAVAVVDALGFADVESSVRDDVACGVGRIRRHVARRVYPDPGGVALDATAAASVVGRLATCRTGSAVSATCDHREREQEREDPAECTGHGT